MPVSALPAMRAAIAYSAPAAAASNWWLADGTIDAANAIAVYQPKGAASLAASYTNLANPGTYDAAPGVAPTFNTATGWTFNGSEWLETGVTPGLGNNWSAIVRWTNSRPAVGSNFTFLGTYDPNTGTSTRFFFAIRLTNSTTSWFAHGAGTSYTNVSNSATSGVFALAGAEIYVDGVSSGTISQTTTAESLDYTINIGRRNSNSPGEYYNDGAIQAIAIYDTTLTSDQVAAVSTAMAAL